jgi:hypothetical protein
MTRIAAMLMGQADPLPQISELNSEVPPAIAAVIEKAMTPHPDQRYQSAALMRQALRNASRNAPDVNFHRTPTIILNGPDKNSVAAAAAAAINYDGRKSKQLEPGPAPEEAAPVKSAEGTDDHVIILLDEGKQQVPVRNNKFKPPKFELKSGDTDETITATKIPEIPNRPLLAGVGAVLLFLLLASGIFLYIMPDLRSRVSININPGPVEKTANKKLDSSKKAEKPEAPIVKSAVRVEALRYYLEMESAGGNKTKRSTGFTSLAAGSKFRFHFKSRENGYLYLIALGTEGIQTFLTAKPIAATGVTTNRLEGGKDFRFPDEGQWFEIQPDSDKTPFIVIFSPNQLKKPAFLSAPGRNLNDAEKLELNQLRKKSAVIPPELVETGDKDTPDMVVQVPPDRPANQPLIFELSLKKR